MGDYYILTRRGAPATQVTVFSAGRHGDEQTVAVFTSSDQARRFAAGWTDSDDVRRLDGRELLEWLIDVFRAGVQRLAIDPERCPSSGERLSVSLSLLLGETADSLAERIRGRLPGAEPDPLVAFRCAVCNKVRRQFLHQSTPVCCGTAMQRGAGRRLGEELARGES